MTCKKPIFTLTETSISTIKNKVRFGENENQLLERRKQIKNDTLKERRKNQLKAVTKT